MKTNSITKNTKQAQVSQVDINAIVSDVRNGYDTRYALTMVGWSRTQINAAIEQGKIVDTLGLITLPLSGYKTINTAEEILAEGKRLVASSDPALREAGYCLLGSLEGHDDWLTNGLEEEEETKVVEAVPFHEPSETRKLARAVAIERIYNLAGECGLSKGDVETNLRKSLGITCMEELRSDEIKDVINDLKGLRQMMSDAA